MEATSNLFDRHRANRMRILFQYVAIACFFLQDVGISMAQVRSEYGNTIAMDSHGIREREDSGFLRPWPGTDLVGVRGSLHFSGCLIDSPLPSIFVADTTTATANLFDGTTLCFYRSDHDEILFTHPLAFTPAGRTSGLRWYLGSLKPATKSEMDLVVRCYPDRFLRRNGSNITICLKF